MAITILNQPTNPNVSQTKLVFSVTSSNVNQPQFQYVTDVSFRPPGGGPFQKVTRLLTYPNLAGSGIIEIGKIVDDNLSYNNSWETGSFGETLGGINFDSLREYLRQMRVEFGEAYGTSISSSVTIYNDLLSSSIYNVWPGTVDPNQGSFNYLPTGSNTIAYLTNQGNNGRIAKGNQVALDIMATKTTANSQHVVQFLDSDDSILSQTTTLSTPASPSSAGDSSTRWWLRFGSGSSYSSSFDNLDWEKIKIFRSGSGDPQVTYTRVRPCNDEGVTFSFINKLGAFDYYSIPNPTRKVTNVQRDIYDQNYVDYSSNTSIYSYEKRGQTQYNTGYTDTFEITTDYVDKATADWLTELFDSPDVYIQENGNFIPILITNTGIDWNMNENRQKLFQYTIQYKYANNRPDR